MPKPPKLPRSSWKTPPLGYDRKLGWYFCLEAHFEAAPIPLVACRPWETVAELLEMLGDHRVSMDSWAGTQRIARSEVDFRKSTYTHKFDAMASTLAKPEFWRRLGPAAEDLWSMEAMRGGSSPQRVWSLWNRLGRDDEHVGLALRVARTHVLQSRIKTPMDPLWELAQSFLARASAAGACYGRGDMRYTHETYREIPFDPPLTALAWAALRPGRDVAVPDLHSINLLNAQLVRRLGGLEALGHRIDSRTHGWRVEELEGGAVLLMPVAGGPWALDFEERSPANTWLNFAALFSAAGVFAIDVYARAHPCDLKAVTAAHDRLEQEQREREARRDGLTQPAAPRPTRPPRFLQGLVKPAPASRTTPENRLCFDVVGTGSDGALTVYGLPAGPREFYGVLRAGSPHAGRAIFSFDARVDGYDAEIEYPPTLSRRKLAQLVCPSCQGRLFRLRLEVEYPDDLDPADPQQAARPEDFFSWLTAIARCAGCAWTGTVAEIETA